VDSSSHDREYSDHALGSTGSPRVAEPTPEFLYQAAAVGCMSALREMRHIARDVTVWVAWFVLTLRLSHGRTYGDLRRLGPRQWAIHLAPMAVVGSVAVHVHLNMPTGLKWVLAAGGSMGVALGGSLVLSTVVVSRLIDLSFTYR